MKRYGALLAAMALCATSLSAQPGIWSNSFNVSNNIRISRSPDMDIDGQSKIHLIWADNARLGGGISNDILYRYFNGQLWSPIEQLSDSAITYSMAPVIALDSLQGCHVVWYDNGYIYEGYYAKILYSFKQNDQWSTPLVLSEGAHYNFCPHIDIDTSNRIHVVWHGVLPGAGFQILYRVFDGNQWLPIQSLTSMPNGCGLPKIRIDSQDNMHLVFVEGTGYSCQIMYMHNDGGGWSQPVPISGIVGLGAHDPDLALDDNDNPHIVWEQNVPYIGNEIYYSGFNGISWSSPTDISNLGGHSGQPHISITPQMKCVSFGNYPVGVYGYLAFVYCMNSTWSVPDTVFFGYMNRVLESSMNFDSLGHLQLVSSVFSNPTNADIYHVAYINSSSLLASILTPHNPPIIIPRSGGSFQFDLQIGNQAVLPVTFDIWINMLLPNGSLSAPILLRRSINLASNGVISRPNLMQNIPRSALPGLYYYCLRAGDYSDSIIVSSDSFLFVKEGVSVSAGGEWLLDGWEGDSSSETGLSPASFALLPSNPNPFNPSTTLTFTLPAAARVKLSVFDITGRQVAALVDGFRDAGIHEVYWNAAEWPSGIYCACLEAGGRSAVQKVVLLK